MHYLLEKKLRKASETYLQLSQQEVKTKQKKRKKSQSTFYARFLHALESLVYFMILNFSSPRFAFFGLLSIFLRQTRVIDELARASSALRI